MRWTQGGGVQLQMCMCYLFGNKFLCFLVGVVIMHGSGRAEGLGTLITSDGM